MLGGSNSCKQVDLGLQVILDLAKVSGYIKGAIKSRIKPFALRDFHIINMKVGSMGLFCKM